MNYISIKLLERREEQREEVLFPKTGMKKESSKDQVCSAGQENGKEVKSHGPRLLQVEGRG